MNVTFGMTEFHLFYKLIKINKNKQNTFVHLVIILVMLHQIQQHTCENKNKLNELHAFIAFIFSTLNFLLPEAFLSTFNYPTN